MVQRLEREAGAHRAVADDRDVAAPRARPARRRVVLQLVGDRHAERGRDRRARVADAEGVVLALGAARKRGEPAVALDGVQPVAPAGQHLVRVGLVADVPHQPVVRRVVHVVQREGELDGAEARREMTAHLAHGLDQVAPQLVGDTR